MKKIYFDRKYVTIFYDQESHLGGAVWKDFMNSEEFREAIQECLGLLRKYKPSLWLADNRGLKAIRQADQEWMLEVALPEIAMSSIQKMATLIPKDIFGQMAMESMFTKADDRIGYDNAFFQNDREALHWLLTDTPYASISHSPEGTLTRPKAGH